MPASSQVDVLVVGAGPAGLVCANAVSRAGLTVRIIDNKAVKTAGHADGVMPRTTEVIQSYGLGEKFLRQGNQVHTIAFYNARDDGSGIALTNHLPMINEPTARYPHATTLHQGAVEDIFIQSLAEAGVDIDRPVKPIAIHISEDPKLLADPNSYPVQVLLERLDSGDTPEEVNAKIVLGADGAHSWVRKQLGISMDGESTSHIWGAIDFKPDVVPELFPDWRHISTVVNGDVTIMLIPREDEKVRLYIELGDAPPADVQTGRAEAKKAGAQDMLDLATKAFAPYSMTTSPDKVDWWTNYIVGQRVASKFSASDRVFIAGDACHTHSPKGGQGLNVSMNDSHNLAWKIVYFLKGWANHGILKTYESERQPVAREVIAFDKWFSAGFSAKARAEIFGDSGQAAPEPLEAFRSFSSLTTGIGIQYAPSSLVWEHPSASSPASGLSIGQRIPPFTIIRGADSRPLNLQDQCPADCRFKILVLPGDLSIPKQAQTLASVAESLAGPQGYLKSYVDFEGMFDIISIVKGGEKKVAYTLVPPELRSSWTKVFVDEANVADPRAGQLYDTFGISPSKGAIVVVRPDGHVGGTFALDSSKDVKAYFDAAFFSQ